MARFYKLVAGKQWIDYGGKWISRQPYNGGVEYVIVEFINWEEATGEPMKLHGDGRDYPNAYCGTFHNTEEWTAKYAVEVTHIDPSWYGAEWPMKLRDALESCGPDAEALVGMTRWDRRTCEIAACSDYGLGDVLDIRYGNNAYRMLRDAKRQNNS